MGLNTAAACGVLANIYCESSFNPNALGDSGTSYGICQWHLSRYTNLKNYCTNNGYDYTTISGQLWYLKYELENGYTSTMNYLKAVSNDSTGAYNAAYRWCYYFEIPANRETVSVTRGNLAKNTYWPKYKPSDSGTTYPTVLPNIKISADSINITWTCNPAPGYATIYIKETGSSQNGVLYIVYPSGANFSKTISRLKAGTTYTIQIDAKGGDIQYRNENIVTTYAADKEVIWEQQENVHPSKEWTIKFSQKIDASTLTNQNISVTDANNNSVNIWLEVGSDGSSVIVKPREDYFSGQTYFLNINRNMRSETGQLLKNPVQMQFSIMP